MKNTTNEFKMGLSGRYKVAIVDAQGQEIWRQPEWQKNLILNQGMNAIASTYLANTMLYGVAGTGSLTVDQVRSNIITASYSSASVIEGGLALNVQPGGLQNFTTDIYEGWSGSLTAGDVIQFYDGTEVLVGSVGATSCAVTPTNTVNTQSFTIWKTSQVGLQAEKKRGGSGIAGSSYLTGVGNCGSSATLNIVSFLRTYDFATEVAPTIYTEVGVGWATSGATTVFSRIKLPTTVSIDTGQRLRLVYQLQSIFTPSASVPVVNATVNGWPVAPATNTSMSQSLQQLFTSTISTAGTSTTTYAACEPPAVGSNCALWGSADKSTLVVFGNTPVNRSTGGDYVGSTADSYVAGTYTVYKNGTFGLSQLNRQDLASFGFGIYAGSANYPFESAYQAFAMVFEQTQSKYNTQTLSMTYKWTWSRTLA